MTEKNLQTRHIKGKPDDSYTPFYEDRNFDWRKIFNKKVHVHHTILDGSTSGNYTTFWIAPFGGTVVNIWEVHNSAGSDNGSLNIEKLDDGTSEGSGTNLLSSDFDLTATANNVRMGSLIRSNKAISKGQRLALKDSGTLTGIGTITVVVELKVRRQ